MIFYQVFIHLTSFFFWFSDVVAINMRQVLCTLTNSSASPIGIGIEYFDVRFAEAVAGIGSMLHDGLLYNSTTTILKNLMVKKN